jgi:hypothetical protein
MASVKTAPQHDEQEHDGRDADDVIDGVHALIPLDQGGLGPSGHDTIMPVRSVVSGACGEPSGKAWSGLRGPSHDPQPKQFGRHRLNWAIAPPDVSPSGAQP